MARSNKTKAKHLKKFWGRTTKVQKLTFVVLILLLPLLLVILQQRQDIRQRADAIDPATGAAQPVGQTGNWQLIFSDEFNGTSLDSTRWIPCYPNWNGQGCDHGNGEQQWYQPQNISFSDGIMHLNGKRESANGYPYTSGMVSSAGKFSDTYYYMEMRAKSPRGRGYWPAFWTLPANNTWPPEIDVLEILGHEPNAAWTTYHWTAGGHQSQGQPYAGPDYSADYHVFAADWRSDAIVWYIDGREVFRFTNASAITNEPMYILVNLAIGGEWPGNPDASTAFPQSFDIDYVRVWKRGTGTNPPITVPTVVPSVPYGCLGPCVPSISPVPTVVPVNPTASVPNILPSAPQPTVRNVEPPVNVTPPNQNNNRGGLIGLLLDLIRMFFELLLRVFGRS